MRNAAATGFESKADIAREQLNVRFTPKSGQLSRGMSALCQERTHAPQQAMHTG